MSLEFKDHLYDQNNTFEYRLLVRNAERYLWLREQVSNHNTMLIAQGLFWNYSSRRQFDRAVDDLMRKEEERKLLSN